MNSETPDVKSETPKRKKLREAWRRLPKPVRYLAGGIAVIALIPVIGLLAYALFINLSPKTYAYDHFAPKQYDFKSFDGPQPGEMAVDFTARDLEGNVVKLSDFVGKTVVLETGSITCPNFVGGLPRMRALAAEFPDVAFLIHYVREAHPGMYYPQPDTIEEKISHARDLASEEGEKRTILVEEIDGKGHQAYGGWPNSIYIIDAAGVVQYRERWAAPPFIREALNRMGAGISLADLHGKSKATMPPNMSRVLRRSGPDATLEAYMMMPVLAMEHFIEGDVAISELDLPVPESKAPPAP
jgi:hypothetical protein